MNYEYSSIMWVERVTRVTKTSHSLTELHQQPLSLDAIKVMLGNNTLVCIFVSVCETDDKQQNKHSDSAECKEEHLNNFQVYSVILAVKHVCFPSNHP